MPTLGLAVSLTVHVVMASVMTNATGMPTTDIPPPGGPPPDQIGWRTMITNWFGSMFFVGLCAPLMVWLAVYCIRTRKKKAKGNSAAKAAIANEIEALGTSHLPTNNKSLPETKKMSKRAHFVRYLGWISSSNTDSPKCGTGRVLQDLEACDTDENNRILLSRCRPERYHRPWSLGNCPSRDISLRNVAERGNIRYSEQLHSSGQTPSSTDIMPSIKEANTPGHSPKRAQATTTGTDVTQFDGLREHRVDSDENEPTMTGALGSEETSGHETIRKRTLGRAQARRWAEMSHELRRSVQSQLLFPSGSRQATPEQPGGPCKREGPDTGTVDYAGITVVDANLKSETTPPVLKSSESGQKMTSPKLRKVHSSPTLRQTFKQLSTSLGDGLSHSSKSPILSHSNPVLHLTRHDQAEAFAKEENTDPFKDSGATSTIYPSGSTLLMNSGNESKSRLEHRAFSFNQTRRSTLDVVGRPIETDRRTLHDYEEEGPFDTRESQRSISEVTIFSSLIPLYGHESSARDTFKCPIEADRQTLDDYEAEGSIDAEMSTRYNSETTIASFRQQNPYNAIAPMSSNSAPAFPSPPTHSLDGIFSMHNEIRLLCGAIFMTSPSGGGLVLTRNGGRRLQGRNNVTDRFATLQMPERRYSFPSLEKFKETDSEVNRKFSFRFPDLKSVQEAYGPRSESLPRRISRVPNLGSSSGSDLVVTRKRASQSPAKKSDRKTVNARKLMPFVTERTSPSPPSTSPQKTLLTKWQPLDRLSEDDSHLPENDLAAPQAKPKHSTYKTASSTTQDYKTCSTSPTSLPRTPCPAQRWTEDPIFGKTPPPPPALTETQLATSGQSIKRAFMSPSSAERMKRKASMAQAGRLRGGKEGGGLKVRASVDLTGEKDGDGRVVLGGGI